MTEHLHRFAVMAADYQEPEAPSGNVLLRLFAPAAAGTTTISLRCEDCGEPATRVVEGRWHQGALRP